MTDQRTALPVTVLGVDPGLARCGVAVLEGPARRARARTAGVLRTAATQALPQRLAQLHAELGALLARHAPDVVAIEKVVFNANVTNAISVGQAAGVVLLAAAQAEVAVVEYSPSQVKATVAGAGDADKRQVGFMVAAALGRSGPVRPADAADALALALCHLQRSGEGAASGPAPRLARAMARDQAGAPVVQPAGEGRDA